MWLNPWSHSLRKSLMEVNPFHVNVQFIYPLKMPKPRRKYYTKQNIALKKSWAKFCATYARFSSRNIFSSLRNFQCTRPFLELFFSVQLFLTWYTWNKENTWVGNKRFWTLIEKKKKKKEILNKRGSSVNFF